MATIPELERARIEELQRCLDASGDGQQTLTYHETQGLLFAVAGSPELVPPSQWLPLIFGGGPSALADEDEAQRVMGTLMALYNQAVEQIGSEQPALPADVEARSPVLTNFEPDAPLAAWSRGFSRGHQWLDELWNELIPDAHADEVGAAVMALCFFGNRELADEVYADLEDPHKPFDQFAGDMLRMMPGALAAYAELARLLQRALHEVRQPQQPARRDKIGRNQRCPCGSGKKYKHCCGDGSRA